MKKIIYVILGLGFTAVIFYFVTLLRHGGQNGPGNIGGAYYLQSDKGKVIVLNDYTSERHGSKGSGYTSTSSWLISLDAATGKEIKRIHSAYIDYVGIDEGKLWMISADTNVMMHSRDPYSLEVVEDYKSLLAKAEAQNPVFKGKIGKWEPDQKHGNLIITAYDASKYYVSPVTFKAHDFTNDRADDVKEDGLSSVGILEQNPLFNLAFKDGAAGKNIYELVGRDAVQLYHLDKYEWTRMDKAFPSGGPPSNITKKHIVNDQHFIDGAFVYDAFTRQPLCFNGDGGVFIYHFDRVGKGQRHMLTQVDDSGTVKTQYDITQTDPAEPLKEAFIADGKLYLVFDECVQCRDSSGKIVWQYTEDTMAN